MAFNAMEAAVTDSLTVTLVGRESQVVTERSRFMTASVGASMSFRQKVDLVAALLRRVPRAPQEERLIQFCVSTLLDLEVERNRIVHSQWTTEGLGGPLQSSKGQVRGGKGLRVTVRDADVAAIMKTVADMENFSELDLIELYGMCCGDTTTWTEPLFKKMRSSRSRKA